MRPFARRDSSPSRRSPLGPPSLLSLPSLFSFPFLREPLYPVTRRPGARVHCQKGTLRTVTAALGRSHRESAAYRPLGCARGRGGCDEWRPVAVYSSVVDACGGPRVAKAPRRPQGTRVGTRRGRDPRRDARPGPPVPRSRTVGPPERRRQRSLLRPLDPWAARGLQTLRPEPTSPRRLNYQHKCAQASTRGSTPAPEGRKGEGNPAQSARALSGRPGPVRGRPCRGRGCKGGTWG